MTTVRSKKMANSIKGTRNREEPAGGIRRESQARNRLHLFHQRRPQRRIRADREHFRGDRGERKGNTPRSFSITWKAAMLENRRGLSSRHDQRTPKPTWKPPPKAKTWNGQPLRQLRQNRRRRRLSGDRAVHSSRSRKWRNSTNQGTAS